jgi:hypothetical protein
MWVAFEEGGPRTAHCRLLLMTGTHCGSHLQGWEVVMPVHLMCPYSLKDERSGRTIDSVNYDDMGDQPHALLYSRDDTSRKIREARRMLSKPKRSLEMDRIHESITHIICGHRYVQSTMPRPVLENPKKRCSNEETVVAVRLCKCRAESVLSVLQAITPRKEHRAPR